MKANIRNGKLVPPPSLEYAMQDIENFDREIERIDRHLSDPARINNYTTQEEYDTWAKNARYAQTQFKKAKHLTNLWIKEHLTAEGLLRDVHAMLLEMSLEVDFEDHEQALLERLDAYFSKRKGEPNGERIQAG